MSSTRARRARRRRPRSTPRSTRRASRSGATRPRWLAPRWSARSSGGMPEEVRARETALLEAFGEDAGGGTSGWRSGAIAGSSGRRTRHARWSRLAEAGVERIMLQDFLRGTSTGRPMGEALVGRVVGRAPGRSTRARCSRHCPAARRSSCMVRPAMGRGALMRRTRSEGTCERRDAGGEGACGEGARWRGGTGRAAGRGEGGRAAGRG